MKTRRWLKVECSPSDTPPILLPRHLPPLLSFAANSLRSHTPLCDSLADTGLPADVRRCSEWICFPPPASCFSQTQKPLPSLSFEGRDNVWQGAGCSSQECSAFAEGPLLGRCRESCAGTGCRLSELDTLPVSRIFQCELRQAVPNLAQIFRPLQKAARTSKQQKHSDWNSPRPSTQNPPAGTAPRPLNPESPNWNSPTPPQPSISRLELPRAPQPQSPSETPSRPFNHNPPSETPRAPSTTISSPRPPAPAETLSFLS